MFAASDTSRRARLSRAAVLIFGPLWVAVSSAACSGSSAAGGSVQLSALSRPSHYCPVPLDSAAQAARESASGRATSETGSPAKLAIDEVGGGVRHGLGIYCDLRLAHRLGDVELDLVALTSRGSATDILLPALGRAAGLGPAALASVGRSAARTHGGDLVALPDGTRAALVPVRISGAESAAFLLGAAQLDSSAPSRDTLNKLALALAARLG